MRHFSSSSQISSWAGWLNFAPQFFRPDLIVQWLLPHSEETVTSHACLTRLDPRSSGSASLSAGKSAVCVWCKPLPNPTYTTRIGDRGTQSGPGNIRPDAQHVSRVLRSFADSKSDQIVIPGPWRGQAALFVGSRSLIDNYQH
jgi:hypothetical protein